MAQLIQPQSSRGNLLDRHLMEYPAQGRAGAAVIGREAQPDIGFNQILGHRPTFSIRQPEIILRKNISLFSLRTEQGRIGLFALKQRDDRDHKAEACHGGSNVQKTRFHDWVIEIQRDNRRLFPRWQRRKTSQGVSPRSRPRFKEPPGASPAPPHGATRPVGFSSRQRASGAKSAFRRPKAQLTRMCQPKRQGQLIVYRMQACVRVEC